MKTLDRLKKDNTSNILKIYATGDLKTRLSSFGVTRGSSFRVLSCSARKQTIKIKIGSTQIALRLEEAQTIEVE